MLVTVVGLIGLTPGSLIARRVPKTEYYALSGILENTKNILAVLAIQGTENTYLLNAFAHMKVYSQEGAVVRHPRDRFEIGDPVTRSRSSPGCRKCVRRR